MFRMNHLCAMAVMRRVERVERVCDERVLY